MNPTPTQAYDRFPALPRHRTVVAVDVEGSTRRTNHRRARMREALYDLVENALLAAGIAEGHRDPLIDRGDGILILIRPADSVPKAIILSRMIPALAALLATHARQNPSRLRLRAAVHTGEVHYDRHGCYGDAIDLTFRLLDAPHLKSALAAAPDELAVVASEDVYRAVIRHEYDGLDKRTFRPEIDVRMGGERYLGWVQTTFAAMAGGTAQSRVGVLTR
ncbi:adenylate/guanylate cyclase domain-containing protein [Amycolatopsis sp. YIM 10]|uniref:adenylate/guanylate cyclase domain-containing protein n=1 Tax=Amycolatopsis sp. YIM 10 TaxID=2653857 RepID=UPI00128FEEAB|nr:adenylate/guanylate cyclase domain-containing protein [Amycolatopsis sp. YIM 10]QFU92735.1 hypothetical protein YIM_37890 [Amycolatopsis sp. YIM 10]